jgi:hypothetical protein
MIFGYCLFFSFSFSFVWGRIIPSHGRACSVYYCMSGRSKKKPQDEEVCIVHHYHSVFLTVHEARRMGTVEEEDEESR